MDVIKLLCSADWRTDVAQNPLSEEALKKITVDELENLWRKEGEDEKRV